MKIFGNLPTLDSTEIELEPGPITNRSFSTALAFYLPDRRTVKAGSKSNQEYKPPYLSRLLSKGGVLFVVGKFLGRIGPKVKVIEEKGFSQEQAYDANLKNLQVLLFDRDQLAARITQLQAQSDSHQGQIDNLVKKLVTQDDAVFNLQKMIKGVFGKAPQIAPPGGKKLWKGPLKKAADTVLVEYQADELRNQPGYRSLRDASDQFHEAHYFVGKPDLTKEQFYANVKKRSIIAGENE